MKTFLTLYRVKLMILVLIMAIGVLTWWIKGINSREKVPSRAKLVLSNKPSMEYKILSMGKIFTENM